MLARSSDSAPGCPASWPAAGAAGGLGPAAGWPPVGLPGDADGGRRSIRDRQPPNAVPGSDLCPPLSRWTPARRRGGSGRPGRGAPEVTLPRCRLRWVLIQPSSGRTWPRRSPTSSGARCASNSSPPACRTSPTSSLPRGSGARPGDPPAAAHRGRAGDRARHGPRAPGHHRPGPDRRSGAAHPAPVHRRRGAGRPVLRDGTRRRRPRRRRPAGRLRRRARASGGRSAKASSTSWPTCTTSTRRGRPGRLRPARGLRRPPGATLDQAVGGHPRPGPARPGRAGRSAGRDGACRRSARASCTATTGWTTACSIPALPGRIKAVLDWEMSTLGDPLTDVGLLFVYWPEAGEDRASMLSPVTALPGFPTRREVAERYAQRTGARPVRPATGTSGSRSSSSPPSSPGSSPGRPPGRWPARTPPGTPSGSIRASSWDAPRWTTVRSRPPTRT